MVQVSFDPLSRMVMLHHGTQVLPMTPERVMALDGDVADIVRKVMSEPSLRLDVPTYSAARGLKPRNYGRLVMR